MDTEQTGGADLTPSWERREGETDKAWSAFCLYRDLGPAERSIDNAYRVYLNRRGVPGGETGAGGKRRAPSHWEAWSKAYEWVKRARDYDAHLELARRQEQERDHLNALEAHRSRAAKLGSAAQEVAVRMLGIANARLLQIERETQQAGRETDEKKKAKLGVIPKGLSTFIRAAGSVGHLGQVSEAHALGVEELMQVLESQD